MRTMENDERVSKILFRIISTKNGFSAWNLQVQTFILLCESGGSGKKEYRVAAITKFT